MKVGDKVVLRKFTSNDSLMWTVRFAQIVGEEVTVGEVDEEDSTFYVSEFDCWWLQSACEPCSETLKNERYFFFSYVSSNSTGNITMKDTEGKMPSNLFVVEYLKKEHLLNNVIITNIFEFQSEQDYLDFEGNE